MEKPVVSLGQLVDDLDLEVVYNKKDLNKIKIKGEEVNRPGLQLGGYYEKFANKRIQIIGNVEWHYLDSLDKAERYKSIEKFMGYNIPCIILSRNLRYHDEFLELARKYDRTLLRTELETTKFINKLLNYLEYQLSLEDRIHGVLIEVYGMGVLLIGESGIGKSETALELVKKGHRLVADDNVKIKRLENRLMGKSPEIIQHFMEVRGIGIIDIERLYGVGAIKQEEFIDLVIELEKWDDNKVYDRLGLDEESLNILGVEVSKILLPVRPGRNLSMLVEVAVKNTRQKKLGYNAALSLNNRLKKYLK